MKSLTHKPQLLLRQIVSQSMLVGSIALATSLSGLIPSLSINSGSLDFGQTVQAQEVTNEELTNYARAVLAMEPRRLQAYNEIKDRAGGTVPQVVCNDTRKINKLATPIRGIAVNYCDQAKKIIESYNLTVAKFNEITLRIQADPNFKQKIQAELVRLQQAPK